MRKILHNQDPFAKEREAIQQDWKKQRFYKFIENIFRPKTTLERYGLLILVLQLVTLACSFISYCTGRVWMEHYIAAWLPSPSTVFWSSVGLLVLLELVKILSAMPIFLSLVRWQPFSKFAAICVLLTYGFSAYISFYGAEKEILSNAKPALISIDSIRTYYDNQIATMEAEKQTYLTDPAHRTSEGIIFLEAKENLINPLAAEILRTKQLRDEKISNAEAANGATEAQNHLFVYADVSEMAWIALGVDFVKLIIALITAWFFVACAAEYDLIHRKEAAPVTPSDTPDQDNRDSQNETVKKTLKQAVTDQENNLGDNVTLNSTKQAETLSEQGKTAVTGTTIGTGDTIVLSVGQDKKRDKEFVLIEDKQTINHRGKSYTKEQVKSYIRKYKARTRESLEEAGQMYAAGRLLDAEAKKKTATNRENMLRYWEGRLSEFA